MLKSWCVLSFVLRIGRHHTHVSPSQLSDLEEAAQDAERVKEEEDNDDDDDDDDDDDETTTTSFTSKTSTRFGTESSQKETVTPSTSPTSKYVTSSHPSSSVTSSASTVGLSACMLSFEIDGEEDVEVGDDGYDPSISGSVDCGPVIGMGGVASGCDNVQTKTRESDTGLEVASKKSSTFSASVIPTSPAIVPFSTTAEQSKPSFRFPDTTVSTDLTFANLPSNPVTPVTTTSARKGIPGPDKLPVCTKYVATQQGYALGIEDYCFCNGILAPLLTHTMSSSSSSSNEILITDCSYSLQPTNTAWSPSSSNTAIVASLTPTTLSTAISYTTDTPDYPVTTALVLLTTLLPPPGRPTIYSTVYIDVPSSTSTQPTIRQTFGTFSKCTNYFTNVDEAQCWANCVGGTCEANHNPFLNSQPWWVCSGCLSPGVAR